MIYLYRYQVSKELLLMRENGETWSFPCHPSHSGETSIHYDERHKPPSPSTPIKMSWGIDRIIHKSVHWNVFNVHCKEFKWCAIFFFLPCQRFDKIVIYLLLGQQAKIVCAQHKLAFVLISCPMEKNSTICFTNIKFFLTFGQ